LLMGLDVWAAPKLAYSLLAGADAVRPGFEAGPVLLGMAVHFALSIGYGIAFAWLAAETPLSPSLLGGFFGLSLYLVKLVILPSLLPHWIGHVLPPNATMHAVAMAEHVVFGLMLAATYRAFQWM